MLINELLENTESNVKWAIGDDIIHGTRPFKNRIVNGTFDRSSIIWVNIKDVFEHTEEGFTLNVDHPSGGKNSIGNRVEKARDFFATGYMEPSQIGYSQQRKSIVFDDGRHRLVAAYQLGERYAPVLVLTSEISKVAGLVDSKEDNVSTVEYMKHVLTQ